MPTKVMRSPKVTSAAPISRLHWGYFAGRRATFGPFILEGWI